MKQLYLYIPIVVIAMITSGFEATAQTTSTPPPQYFTLSLPAGVSLISAPLNTGQTDPLGTERGTSNNRALEDLGPDYISWRKVPCLVNRGGFCPGQPGRLPESDAGSWGAVVRLSGGCRVVLPEQFIGRAR